MTPSADSRAEALRLKQQFEQAGAVSLEADVLQPAATLLDLYGEDIRARAFVTSDPLRGEQMLRPDFTVPVVQMHMEHGAEPARYTYSGVVFRRQEDDASRPSEYQQVGYEVFDREDPAAADAEVFSLLSGALGDLNLRAATGDIGILMAAVNGLNTTDRRKSALMRHIWRPKRFRALLDRFSGKSEVPATRQALLEASDPFAKSGPHIGLRSEYEIQSRIEALKEDAATPPIAHSEVDLLSAILQVRDVCASALEQLRDIAVDMPQIDTAVEGLARRMSALDDRGVDVDALEFEASYGRTSMEYYDGFVFGLYSTKQADMPPVATGGRYDALTRRLGGGNSIPAVGGVIRPDLVLALRGHS